MKWIRDEEFIRGNIPMTKFNIRTLAIAYLAIEKGDRLLDIGAGTGSISIEAALQGANVWAIEKEKEGIDIITKNSIKFNVKLNLIEGQAPEALPDIEINKCFIGGSGGKFNEIFKYLEAHLETGGIVCGNFIRLQNLNNCIQCLEEYKYENIEVQLIQSSYMDKIGLMKGQNPIFIVKGVKI
ncbi:MAG: Precorrin-6Y C5,15-methyltransferase (Decarboxylating), CbiT subunit [Sporanaerobacter sp.]|jgi:cobalt-precorrin-6B (C15)-methyltransferase|uniref:precorrin-6Y C5,15-methyltransferase (decarboxylating) subunit CbiT n=1 Tax=Sporanaerobacter sp. TaxID=2010183 RepID=UPI003A0FE0AA